MQQTEDRCTACPSSQQVDILTAGQLGHAEAASMVTDKDLVTLGQLPKLGGQGSFRIHFDKEVELGVSCVVWNNLPGV